MAVIAAIVISPLCMAIVSMYAIKRAPQSQLPEVITALGSLFNKRRTAVNPPATPPVEQAAGPVDPAQ